MELIGTPTLPETLRATQLHGTICFTGMLYVDAGDRGAYLAATSDVASLARRAPGCLDFVQAADPLHPTRVNVFERWESDADVKAFRIRRPRRARDPDAADCRGRGAEVPHRGRRVTLTPQHHHGHRAETLDADRRPRGAQVELDAIAG